MKTLIRCLLAIAAVLAAGLLALYLWAGQPLARSSQLPGNLALSIAPGSGTQAVAQAIASSTREGLGQELLLSIWLRVSGKARSVKAGSYEIEPKDSPRSLIEKLAAGKQALASITFVEGWNWRQVRTALAANEQLAQDSASLSDAQIMVKLGKPGLHPEGRFFPDTYRFGRGVSDFVVLKAALAAMDKQLAAAWGAKASESPLQSPEQALIMASIVEKETAAAADRGNISGVFANRLRIGMRLQTDPTVIYGLGTAFDGNIRKRDLQTDTPYNTYTRPGLPPTPIAMPGKAALLAAVQPTDTKALYFVARGDGSSQFSETLEQHNRAVDKYIRGR